MMERCLYCYKELAEGEKDFHKACSKKILVLVYLKERLLVYLGKMVVERLL